MDYLPNILDDYLIDFSNELSIDNFLQYGFYKIADATLKSKDRFERNPEVNPIEYVVVPELEEIYKKYCELIYIITVDGKVAKIGGTYVGMKGRHSSYNCGTRKARSKGTCSVTNYKVTEVQYASIRNGKKVEWYIFEVPLTVATINVWGEEVQYNTKTYYKYETALCEKYYQMIGYYPLLSSNSGVE